jgi:hypothetical protein
MHACEVRSVVDVADRVLSNACRSSSPATIAQLVQAGAIAQLCGLLQPDGPDEQLLSQVLDALGCVLDMGARLAKERQPKQKDEKQCSANEYAQLVEECGGLTKLELLMQQHPSAVIRKKTVAPFRTHFDAHDAAAAADASKAAGSV